MLHNTYIYTFQQMRHIHLSDIALTLLYLLRQYLYPYRIRYIYIYIYCYCYWSYLNGMEIQKAMPFGDV